MNKSFSYRLGDLAAQHDLELSGDPDTQITRLASLKSATVDSLTFLADKRHKKYLHSTKAGAVILSPDLLSDCPTNALIAKNPRSAYAKLAQDFDCSPSLPPGIHPSALIGQDVQISESASIGPNCVIGDRTVIGDGVVIHAGCVVQDDVIIGDRSILWSNVTLYYSVKLGSDVIIHSGAVIGADGFGMVKDDDQWVRIPQLGSVQIGDQVEIGAHSTIDRGALEDTIISRGVKLDNHVQVAHNVFIGEHTLIAACTGISGSAKIGAHCTIAGGVGFRDHITVADHVVVLAMSRVERSITTPGVYVSGTALQPFQLWNKNRIRFGQLDELIRQFKQFISKHSEPQP